MAAHGDATVTIDTSELTYPNKDGSTCIVTDGQTIVLDLTAGSGVETYQMKNGKTVTCTNGQTLTFDGDPVFTFFSVATDGTAQYRSGAIRIREWNGSITDWDLGSVTIDNVDEPTALSISATAKDGSNRVMTLTTVTVSQ